jgi:hypothetical protein
MDHNVDIIEAEAVVKAAQRAMTSLQVLFILHNTQLGCFEPVFATEIICRYTKRGTDTNTSRFGCSTNCVLGGC